IVRHEAAIRDHRPEGPEDVAEQLRAAKELGLSDRTIAGLRGVTETQVRGARAAAGIWPAFKMVDTCAAEFEAATPYFYSAYERDAEDEAGALPEPLDRKPRAVVIGSGPIRIGQGIEFDYCSVHSAWALREAGYEAIIVNNNPETVSTDFDTSDRLYFEPLTAEDVLAVIREEQPEGVIVQFGGQTAINLAQPLYDAGVRILGTAIDGIDIAEDRGKFERLLHDLGIPKPAGRAVTRIAAAAAVAEEIGYPVLVRPSYVLGGRAMEIVMGRQDLVAYMHYVVDVSPDAPILIDKYLPGKEVE